MAGAYYDDTRLRKMFEELDPKRRKQALKGAFRKAGLEVRKVAQAELKGKINASKDVLKGIRNVVYKRNLGFRVTVGTKRMKRKGEGDSAEAKRRRRKEIVPLWMLGTKERHRKPRGRIRRVLRMKGGSTGKLAPLDFMNRANTYGMEKAETLIKEQITTQIERIAKKYGSTVS